MAYNFTKHNKETAHKFNYEDKQRSFISLNKLYSTYGEKAVYTILGGYINKKDRYGDRPEIITLANDKKEYVLDAPRSMVDTFKELFSDDEAVAAINNHECKFVIETFHSDKYFKDIYMMKFI